LLPCTSQKLQAMDVLARPGWFQIFTPVPCYSKGMEMVWYGHGGNLWEVGVWTPASRQLLKISQVGQLGGCTFTENSVLGIPLGNEWLWHAQANGCCGEWCSVVAKENTSVAEPGPKSTGVKRVAWLR